MAAAQNGIRALKQQKLEQTALVRERLRKTPDLVWLFFELTTRCNLHCMHCGSSCRSEGELLEPEMIRKALKGVDPRKTMIALTGGEPMLHPQFYEIGSLITSLGFRWGMTSNALLIDDNAAMRLKEAGMRTISVSLDGLEDSHDHLRGQKGAWKKALSGIRALKNAGFAPDVTTVVHPGNINELENLEQILISEGVPSWRIINVEPIGRARNSGLLLDKQGFRYMIDFIRKRHLEGKMAVSFGCSHYLGLDYERMVRDWFFLCGAGITVASIRVNGDICACLDIENRPELVQGNIHTDSFIDVWKNRFEYFRQDRTACSDKCRACPERGICGGDSTHTWDFDNNEPLLCAKEYLED